LKILGIGTAIAVLADSLLVRCQLLPASLTLLGHRTWWLPPALSRLQPRISQLDDSAAESARIPARRDTE